MGRSSVSRPINLLSSRYTYRSPGQDGKYIRTLVYPHLPNLPELYLSDLHPHTSLRAVRASLHCQHHKTRKHESTKQMKNIFVELLASYIDKKIPLTKSHQPTNHKSRRSSDSRSSSEPPCTFLGNIGRATSAPCSRRSSLERRSNSMESDSRRSRRHTPSRKSTSSSTSSESDLKSHHHRHHHQQHQHRRHHQHSHDEQRSSTSHHERLSKPRRAVTVGAEPSYPATEFSTGRRTNSIESRISSIASRRSMPMIRIA